MTKGIYDFHAILLPVPSSLIEYLSISNLGLLMLTLLACGFYELSARIYRMISAAPQYLSYPQSLMLIKLFLSKSSLILFISFLYVSISPKTLAVSARVKGVSDNSGPKFEDST